VGVAGRAAAVALEPVALEAVDEWTHPSGTVRLDEMSEIEMETAVGGATSVFGTWGCCWCVPWYSSWTRCGLVCGDQKCSY
jgi:hypothetical protein